MSIRVKPITNLLPSGFRVLLFSLPHGGHELDEDGLSVLHLFYGFESRISTMLQSKFTECCSTKKKESHSSSLVQ